MIEEYHHNSQEQQKILLIRNGYSNIPHVQMTINENTKIHDIYQKTHQQFGLNRPESFRIFDPLGIQINNQDLPFTQAGQIHYISDGQDFDSNSSLYEYDILEKLGEGGFGTVMLGQHQITKEKVAIKTIKTEHLRQTDDIDLIFMEADVMRSLQHQNIVKLLNCFTLPNHMMIYILEFLEGGELLQRVEKLGRISEKEAKIYFYQIAEAMKYCHSNNLIHRDLKLENVMLSQKDGMQIKIVDFGIAGVNTNKNVSNIDAGSLCYMSPEVLGGKIRKLLPSIDIWAMGIMLYAMLIGKLPFTGSKFEIVRTIIEGKVDIPTENLLQFSPDLVDLFGRILDKNFARRISAADILQHPWMNELQGVNFANLNIQEFSIQKENLVNTTHNSTFRKSVSQLQMVSSFKNSNMTSRKSAFHNLGHFNQNVLNTNNSQLGTPKIGSNAISPNNTQFQNTISKITNSSEVIIVTEAQKNPQASEDDNVNDYKLIREMGLKNTTHLQKQPASEKPNPLSVPVVKKSGFNSDARDQQKINDDNFTPDKSVSEMEEDQNDESSEDGQLNYNQENQVRKVRVKYADFNNYKNDLHIIEPDKNITVKGFIYYRISQQSRSIFRSLQRRGSFKQQVNLIQKLPEIIRKKELNTTLFDKAQQTIIDTRKNFFHQKLDFQNNARSASPVLHFQKQVKIPDLNFFTPEIQKKVVLQTSKFFNIQQFNDQQSYLPQIE